MSEQQTRFTLVLGAGASFDFGLPLGVGLRDTISRDLNIKFGDFGQKLISGNYDIVQALQSIVRNSNGELKDINSHRAAAVQIADAMPYSSSIDEYIERHGDDLLKAQCAKLAISKAILEAERKSSIFGDPKNPSVDPLKKAANSWIALFLRDITRGLRKVEISNALSEFSIINFNYDRCFEHFVFHWLKRMYEFDDGEAGAILSGMSIFHPYGRLGDLQFESPNGHIPFGGEIDTHRLVTMMERVRTYSEAVESNSGIDPALMRMNATKKIVFLGFGFHKQNMELLGRLRSGERSSARCYATSFEVPEPRWEIFRGRIAEALHVSSEGLFIERASTGCADFWTEYGDAILS